MSSALIIRHRNTILDSILAAAHGPPFRFLYIRDMIGSTMAKKPDEKESVPDHRKIGQELDLFTTSDLVGSGLPSGLPRGTIVRQELDRFVWEMRSARGYERVTIRTSPRRNCTKSRDIGTNSPKTFSVSPRARAANMR